MRTVQRDVTQICLVGLYWFATQRTGSRSSQQASGDVRARWSLRCEQTLLLAQTTHTKRLNGSNTLLYGE